MTTADVFAQADPASEPTVLAVAKALPAVVNINTERVVRRRVRDPFEDFAGAVLRKLSEPSA
jgi:S1-C subfamily serine protease